MRQNRMGVSVCALVLSLLLPACGGTKLKHVRINPAFKGKPVSNVLVIGVTYKEKDEMRKTFEDVFARSLKAQGVDAVAAGDAISIPSDLMLTKEDVEGAVRKYNNDAIIVARLVDVEEKEFNSRDSLNAIGYYSFYTQSYLYVHNPTFTRLKTHYIFETRLYDVKTETLIWSGIIDSVNPESSREVLTKVIGLTLGSLQRNNLIPQAP